MLAKHSCAKGYHDHVLYNVIYQYDSVVLHLIVVFRRICYLKIGLLPFHSQLRQGCKTYWFIHLSIHPLHHSFTCPPLNFFPESNSLEGLMTNLSRSIKQTNWLQENTASRWAEENPDAYSQWMDAIKDRPQQSSSSQTAVAVSESTGSQTLLVPSQHTGCQTPAVSSQSSSSQTNVLNQDAGNH